MPTSILDLDNNSGYDWGFTLIPETVLSQILIVGWAPGDDPTFLGTNLENTAPIWLTGGHPKNSLTPTATYDLCVDYNGNGGATYDPAVRKWYDSKITGLAPLEPVKVYKDKTIPPGTGQGTAGDDQTGTQIWVCGPTTGTGEDTELASDTLLAAAWGADPLVASPSKPGVDMGYTVRNQLLWRALKEAQLQVDLNGNGLYDESDTIRYSIRVFNTSPSLITMPMTVTDDLPFNATYVPNSTYLINDGTAPPFSGPVADSGSGTAFPLDDTGYTYTNLNPWTSFTLYFDVTIDVGASAPPSTVLNIAHVTDGIRWVHPEVTIVVQPPRHGAIGNYVWLDEDGDGDQDAGESGISNLTVRLCSDAACTVVLETTITDNRGGYHFHDLEQGTYYVNVIPQTGMDQTYDENGPLDHTSQVILGPGREYMMADFGYNWNTPTETNNPTLGTTGAIGDYVWLDVEGDGRQGTAEVGIPGVAVDLYTAGPDGLFGTGDDVLHASTVTDNTGHYIFDDLPQDAYVVKIPTPPSGYTQSGDPDRPAQTCVTCDNQTTTPILVSPGDVYVGADFGYTPTTATVGAIGDTIWMDADRDGIVDAGEPRLPLVTVVLISDSNGNGVWDSGEPIIATDVSKENGDYLFPGVPAGNGEDYLVYVNDTNIALEGLVPVYDSRWCGHARDQCRDQPASKWKPEPGLWLCT